MTADQTPMEDPHGMPGELPKGDDRGQQQASHDDLSLQELSDVYAELINDEPPAARPPAAPATGPSVVEEQAAIDRQEITPSSILEAILFVGHPENKPLMPRDVTRVIRGVTVEEVEQLVEGLNECYQRDSTPYEITCIEGGYVMQLREEALQLRENFYNKIKQKRLSQAAIDVLAIVAYNQGIMQEDVNRLRDRSSGAILSQLVRRKILRVQQADEKPRKPRYFTGDRFLDLFGLETIDDLPQTHDLEKSA